MDSNLGVGREQSFFLEMVLLEVILAKILRVKGQCLEENMAIDRVLKLKC